MAQAHTTKQKPRVGLFFLVILDKVNFKLAFSWDPQTGIWTCGYVLYFNLMVDTWKLIKIDILFSNSNYDISNHTSNDDKVKILNLIPILP